MPIYQSPFYVYKLVCLNTNQFYFGSRYAHSKKARLPKDDLFRHYYSSSRKVHDLIKSFGKESFLYEVLFESFDRDATFWYEQDCIKNHFGDPLLVNEYFVKRTSNGRVFGMNQENLDKMTKAVNDLVAAGKHNFLGGELQRAAQLRLLEQGKHTSQDPVWLANHREHQRSVEGRKRKSDSLSTYWSQDSEEVKKRKEHLKSPEHVAMLRSSCEAFFAQNPDKRTTNQMFTPEANAKRKKTHKYRARVTGGKPWFICENTGQVFCNHKHVSEVMDISSTAVGLVLRGKYSDMKGYKFRYLTPEEVTEYLKSEAYHSLVQLYKPPS